MTTAVTGATGQLGGLVIDELLARGIAAADLPSALAAQITAALTSEQGTASDAETADDALGVTVDMATGEILEG